MSARAQSAPAKPQCNEKTQRWVNGTYRAGEFPRYPRHPRSSLTSGLSLVSTSVAPFRSPPPFRIGTPYRDLNSTQRYEFRDPSTLRPARPATAPEFVVVNAYFQKKDGLGML
jgi:hypothetical protein